MTSATTQSYLRSQVMSASPQELRLMLLDAAIRFASQGRDGLRERDYERSFEGVSQARAIVTELATGVDRQADPELCDRVTGVFMHMFSELTQANLERDPERVQRVIDLLAYERETWAMAMERVRAETPDQPAAAPQAGSLSVQA